MDTLKLPTKSLTLVSLTREETVAMIEAMSPEDRAEVSADWMAALHASASVDPWRHGFSMVHRETGSNVGSCAFKGPPTDGCVEIAYGVDPEHRCKGYATEAAEALTQFAFAEKVPLVIAHTRAEPNASTHVLTKCGFEKIGEVMDPEDGLLWRWERRP